MNRFPWIRSCNICARKSLESNHQHIKSRFSEVNGDNYSRNCELCGELIYSWWLVHQDNPYVQKCLTIDVAIADATRL